MKCTPSLQTAPKTQKSFNSTPSMLPVELLLCHTLKSIKTLVKLQSMQRPPSLGMLLLMCFVLNSKKYLGLKTTMPHALFPWRPLAVHQPLTSRLLLILHGESPFPKIEALSCQRDFLRLLTLTKLASLPKKPSNPIQNQSLEHLHSQSAVFK